LKTFLPKKNELKNQWFLLDASTAPLGKIAVEAARRLAGKHRADFTPHLDLGDGVIVVNASKVNFSGNKLIAKKYRSHSGYRGHLKEISAGELIKKNPEKIVRLAVSGMLPKNKLKDQRLKRLRVFTEADHSHAAQKPEEIIMNDELKSKVKV
jgi:large subunit ribosomal protein L13